VAKRVSKKRRAVERHAVEATLTAHGLTNNTGSALHLEIYRGSNLAGEINIGRGSLQWRGGRRHSWRRISWTRFAEMVDELAYAHG
jgi:hypothetical protein